MANPGTSPHRKLGNSLKKPTLPGSGPTKKVPLNKLMGKPDMHPRANAKPERGPEVAD